MKKIGVIMTIRNSSAITEFVKESLAFPEGVEVLVRGSQDHMSDEQVREQTGGVEPGMYADQLSDESFVFFNKADILSNMRIADAWLKEQGCTANLVFCSNDYSELEDIDDLVLPSKLIINTTLALVKKGAVIGVLNPVVETMALEVQKWKHLEAEGYKIINTNAAPIIPESPELAMMSEEEISSAKDRPVEASHELVEQGADFIVLDCMGYSTKNRFDVSQASGKAVLDPQSLSAQVMILMYGLT